MDSRGLLSYHNVVKRMPWHNIIMTTSRVLCTRPLPLPVHAPPPLAGRAHPRCSESGIILDGILRVGSEWHHILTHSICLDDDVTCEPTYLPT